MIICIVRKARRRPGHVGCLVVQLCKYGLDETIDISTQYATYRNEKHTFDLKNGYHFKHFDFASFPLFMEQSKTKEKQN